MKQCCTIRPFSHKCTLVLCTFRPQWNPEQLQGWLAPWVFLRVERYDKALGDFLDRKENAEIKVGQDVCGRMTAWVPASCFTEMLRSKS